MLISYQVGIFDILREEDLKKLDREIQLSKKQGHKYFALGVYSEEICQKLGMGTPLKSLEDRMKIMSWIRGIDFVFPVTHLSKELQVPIIQNYYDKFLEEKKAKKETKKDYTISYAPGTYDLFHAGHLENLLIAASHSKKLIVGVKSDELVQKHKNKTPNIDESERMEILRHFKFVDDVYLYFTRDLLSAKDWINSKFGKLDAVFLGSDLEKDFKDIKGINIVFTSRPPENMAVRSTTALSKKLKSRPNNSDRSRYRGPKLNMRGTVVLNDHER